MDETSGPTAPDVAAAEADAVALLTAARAGAELGAKYATKVAEAEVAHRVLVAFLVLERALLLTDGTGLKASGVAGQAVELLRTGQAATLRSLLHRHAGQVAAPAAAAFLADLAFQTVAATGADAVDEQLRTWALHVADSPGERAARHLLTDK